MARMVRPGQRAHEQLFSKKESKALESEVEKRRRTEELNSKRCNKLKNLANANICEAPIIREKLKSMLPTLTSTEVRRYRIPYYKAVILELEENGSDDAAQFLKMLFELDEKMRAEIDSGSVLYRKSRLKDQKEFIERLRIGLSKSNDAKKAGFPIDQMAALLDMALYFQTKSWEWRWITEKLFKSALIIGEKIEDDDRRILAMTKYLYGRFLFDEMNNLQGALDHLNEARELSRGKTWNASKMLNITQESLFRECCNLLYKILLTLARQVREENPVLAAKACISAQKRAADSGHNEYIAEALYELGKSQFSAGDTGQALQSFSKFLALTRKIPDPEGICNAHMQLAIVYKEIKDEKNTMKHLQMLKENASNFKLPYKLAQAHYYIGEQLLNQSQPNLATPYLEHAFALYNNLGLIDEGNRARSIAAISKGQEVMDRFIELILKCGEHDPRSTLKICHWKNSKIPFWLDNQEQNTDDERDMFQSDSIEEK